MIENNYKMIGFHSQALLRHLHCSVRALPKQCQYIFNVQGPGTGGRSPKVGGGGQGAGDREKRGREVYGRWEKRGGKWEKKGKIT